MNYKRDKHHVYLLNYHVIWSPKRRKKVLVGDIRKRLIEIIHEVEFERGLEVLGLEVMPDHVHLFFSADPSTPIHKHIRAFKGRSSRLLRREFPSLLKIPSLWTHSYFVTTAGNVSSKTILKYIENQPRI